MADVSDQVQRAHEDLRALARDYFGLTDSETTTLLEIASQCARTQGLAMGAAGAAGLSAVGAVTVPGLGAIPGWLAGALAGFVGGTTACVIARRSLAEGARRVLSENAKSESDFRAATQTLLRLGAHPARDRHS